MACCINGSFDIVVSNFHLLATNALSSSQAWLCAQQKSRDLFLNPLWPSDAIWHHKSWATSIQVMACHQFSTKPLPGPMIALKMKFHWNFNENSIVFVEEMHFKVSSANCSHFVQVSMCRSIMSSLASYTPSKQDIFHHFSHIIVCLWPSYNIPLLSCFLFSAGTVYNVFFFCPSLTPWCLVTMSTILRSYSFILIWWHHKSS